MRKFNRSLTGEVFRQSIKEVKETGDFAWGTGCAALDLISRGIAHPRINQSLNFDAEQVKEPFFQAQAIAAATMASI